LEGWLRSRSAPQALATRARIVLGSADGASIRQLAERLEVSQCTICLRRRRYREAGLAGLRSLPRAGRPRIISAAKERAVLSATMRKPAAATHWSTRRLAKAVVSNII
jgi:transposase